MPLRFIWGAQKGGTTGLWEMLHPQFVCGANQRFDLAGPSSHGEQKESHYLDIRKIPSRFTYMEAYLQAQCASHCFVDATPNYLMVPLAAARLKSMMSSAEAVRCRRTRCIASAFMCRSRLALI
jgi:hypothetical protein